MVKNKYVQKEEEIRAFWDKNKIYQKQKAKGKKGKDFYFLDGPPYTSGKLHVGTAWNKSLKDMLLRYKRMAGFNVWDRAGWDMHGMPVELRTAKKLGLKTKEDIQEFGVAKFAKECINFANGNLKLMEEEFQRIGVWMDFENAYKSVDNKFMENVWWLIKQAHDKNLLYEGDKTMTWCADCGTALAKHELEYENVTEDSIFLKFQSRSNPKEFFIIWTTTPWTIPLNLAIMVNPEINYLKVKVDGEVWIIAEALTNIFLGMLGKKYKILKKFKGKTLKGEGYIHPYEDEIKVLKELKKKHKKAYTVLLSEEYVDTSGGSGLVHCAPGCGPEDQEVGAANGLPAFNELDEYGVFSKKMGKFAGKKAKRDDSKFIEEFKKKGCLIETTQVEHEYAHCWRCKNPVVFRATKQWFFAIEPLKDLMLKENKKVTWVPDVAGSANFANWLKNLKDNAITRQRFWGTPVPIWKCTKCKDISVFGSAAELKKAGGKVPANLHKPWIDKVKCKCKCGGTKERIPDILDVWIDAGSVSWNCLGYPGNKKDWKLFPADFILEGHDQIRGWFNMLYVASMIAMKKHCYKAVYMHGFVQDSKGRKMSKSLGNIISPNEVIDKFSIDTMRYYMTGATKPGIDMNYNFADAQIRFRNLDVLRNTAKYIISQAKFAGVNPTKLKLGKTTDEDKYMISKLNHSIALATDKFDNYLLNEIPDVGEKLYLELSRWYIKNFRDDFNSTRIKIAYDSLMTAITILAPIIPFTSEEVYQDLKKEFKLKEKSIHLVSWPKSDSKKINKTLEAEIETTKTVLKLLLASREKANRGVRWPVKEATIVTSSDQVKDAVKKYQDMICSRANVLNIKSGKLDGLTFNVKVNFQTLGPKYGEDVALITGKLAEISSNTLVEGITKKGKYAIKVNNKYFELLRNDVIIEEIIPEGYAGQSLGNVGVYLNLEETPDMILNGFMREIARKVQALRKKSGLQKPDKISLQIVAPVDVDKGLEKLVKDFKAKVGAKELEFVAHLSLKEKDDFTIRGKKIEIGLKKI
jgi:isoleucyl-tRNA synthetase